MIEKKNAMASSLGNPGNPGNPMSSRPGKSDDRQTADVLLEYLRSALYTKDDLVLDVESLADDYQSLGQGIVILSRFMREAQGLIEALAQGDLDATLPSRENELAAPLKALHSSLKHMTWQAQQVAKGDYGQRLEFMGDFAEAFNEMTEQLKQRQDALAEEVERGRRKTEELEQSALLLEDVTTRMPQLLMVVQEDTQEILYTNDAARKLDERDPSLSAKLVEWVLARTGERVLGKTPERDYCRATGTTGTYVFTINPYQISWYEEDVLAYVLSDVTEEWEYANELEFVAHRDILTGLHNRYYCMSTMREWRQENRALCVALIDLDNLKFVNDTFGHIEGDRYIIHVAEALKLVDPNAVVCRLGGDEFVLLVSNMSELKMIARLVPLREEMLRKMPDGESRYLRSFSFGVVDSRNHPEMYSAGDLLGLADERMYEFKRAHKPQRAEVISKSSKPGTDYQDTRMTGAEG